MEIITGTGEYFDICAKHDWDVSKVSLSLLMLK